MMCYGKIKFQSYSEAEKINKKRSRRSGHKRTTRTPPRIIYRCKICNLYHLAHKE